MTRSSMRSAFEQRLEENPQLALAAAFYWIRKLETHGLRRRTVSAAAAALQSAQLLWTLPTYVEFANITSTPGWRGRRSQA